MRFSALALLASTGLVARGRTRNSTSQSTLRKRRRQTLHRRLVESSDPEESQATHHRPQSPARSGRCLRPLHGLQQDSQNSPPNSSPSTPRRAVPSAWKSKKAIPGPKLPRKKSTTSAGLPSSGLKTGPPIKTSPYRIRHGEKASFHGLIRKDPVDKSEIVLAALSCNSNRDRGMRDQYVFNIAHQNPDLVFYAGDQSYDHKEHTAAWLKWGIQFRETFRTRPCIAIPDDHDIGQGNLWGGNGKVAKLRSGADGGYFFHPEYVKMVERCQTGQPPRSLRPHASGAGHRCLLYQSPPRWCRFCNSRRPQVQDRPQGPPPHEGPPPRPYT